jgi:hypothetical protein
MTLLLLGAITLGDLAVALGFVAGVLSSILIIWAFSDKYKKARKSNVEEIIKDALDRYDTAIEKRMDKADVAVQREITKDIQALSCKLDKFIDKVEKNSKMDHEYHELYSESLIELYKKQIRDIYYNLRETGVIADKDKAYVDKIYPRYKALGGNSDIEAKYSEMCSVHEKTTQEAYDKAREEYFKLLIEEEEKNKG